MSRRIRAPRGTVLEDWGNGATLDLLGLPHDEAARRRYGEYERSAITRGDLACLIEIFLAMDVRDVLHRVELPTLVLHEDNHLVSEDQARYLAKGIASSRLQILSDRYFWRLAEDDYPAGIDIALEFLTGVAFERDLNRELLTIVFLDIVESTKHVETLGDRRWTMLLEQFDDLVHTQLRRYRGEYINSTGDGLLAVFHSPTPHVALEPGDAVRGAAPRHGAASGHPHRRVPTSRRGRPGRGGARCPRAWSTWRSRPRCC